jgi:hypothetical protein
MLLPLVIAALASCASLPRAERVGCANDRLVKVKLIPREDGTELASKSDFIFDETDSETRDERLLSFYRAACRASLAPVPSLVQPLSIEHPYVLIEGSVSGEKLWIDEGLVCELRGKRFIPTPDQRGWLESWLKSELVD